MIEIEIERFECPCGHSWWGEPGQSLGLCEVDKYGRRVNWDVHVNGCYKCGSLYFTWTTYESFAERRRERGGLAGELRDLEEEYLEGLQEFDRVLELIGARDG